MNEPNIRRVGDYAVEFAGTVVYYGDGIPIGSDLIISGVAGRSPANVYVRRFVQPDEWKGRIAEIVISVGFDGYADELFHSEPEADNHPLGPKEYWRARLVGRETGRISNHEFEHMWARGDEPAHGFSGHATASHR